MFPVRNPNPTSIRPLVTIGLMVACILVFVWVLSLEPRETLGVIYRFAVIPAFFIQGVEPIPSPLPVELTVITSMFLHADILHLAGNLLFLWIFGKTIEDATGHARFILFYFLGGIIAILTHILLNPTSQNPMIGASGAISAVLGAYLRLFPHSRIVIFYLRGIYPDLARVPAEWVLVFWFVLQLLYGIFTEAGQKTMAWEVHLSGFIMGLLLIPLFYHPPK
jgi:membrane associated rhomboid family serine protease